MKLRQIENTIFVLGVVTCLLGCYTIDLPLVQLWFFCAMLPLSLGIIGNEIESKKKS
jgi:hypothetical protein